MKKVLTIIFWSIFAIVALQLFYLYINEKRIINSLSKEINNSNMEFSDYLYG